MIWVTNIGDLSYYNRSGDVPCYCDKLFNPQDLILQAYLGNLMVALMTNFSVSIHVYSPDGLTDYGDASSYFNWVIINTPNFDHYLNIQLNGNFAPQMLSHGSFILEVVVTVTNTMTNLPMTAFSAFTDQYCSPCCPPDAEDVTITLNP